MKKREKGRDKRRGRDTYVYSYVQCNNAMLESWNHMCELSYVEHSKFQLLNIVIRTIYVRYMEWSLFELRLQCTKESEKIAWNIFRMHMCECKSIFSTLTYSLSLTRSPNVRLQTIVMERSKCKYTHASHVRTHIQAYEHRHTHERRNHVLCLRQVLCVDYIDVRSQTDKIK